MMFTDEGLQDEWAVVCVYENQLPDHIKKAIFVADSASCFNSKLHRAIQILSESWTGITDQNNCFRWWKVSFRWNVWPCKHCTHHRC